MKVFDFRLGSVTLVMGKFHFYGVASVPIQNSEYPNRGFQRQVRRNQHASITGVH